MLEIYHFISIHLSLNSDVLVPKKLFEEPLNPREENS